MTEAAPQQADRQLRYRPPLLSVVQAKWPDISDVIDLPCAQAAPSAASRHIRQVGRADNPAQVACVGQDLVGAQMPRADRSHQAVQLVYGRVIREI